MSDDDAKFAAFVAGCCGVAFVLVILVRVVCGWLA